MECAGHSAQPPQHSHSVRGKKFHGLQFKDEGQETLTVTHLQLDNPAICVYVYKTCVTCSRQGAHGHMQTSGSGVLTVVDV